jgi:hypothetical protein
VTRLPNPGGDDNQWGDILNAYLSVSLDGSGSLKNNVVGTNQIQNNAVTNAQLDSSTQNAIASANSKYTKPTGGIPSSDMTSAVQTSLSKADSSLQSAQLGAPNGIATLDSGSKLTNSQLPGSLVINGGSLGATPSLTLTSPSVQYTGILSANCALTISGLTAGCSGTLQLQQDSSGGHSLTINGTPVSVPQTALAQFAVQFFSSDGSTLMLVPPAPNFTTARTYAVSGSINVASGGTNYLPPFDEPVDGGVAKQLVKVIYAIRGGTSVTFAITQNGATVSGLGSLSATPTSASTAPSSTVSVSDGDSFAVVVSAVSGSPDGLKVSFVFETVQ